MSNIKNVFIIGSKGIPAAVTNRYESIAASENQSFVYSDTDDSWIDYGKKNNANIHIKAFTNNVQSESENKV